jgi:hypothetical protein
MDTEHSQRRRGRKPTDQHRRDALVTFWVKNSEREALIQEARSAGFESSVAAYIRYRLFGPPKTAHLEADAIDALREAAAHLAVSVEMLARLRAPQQVKQEHKIELTGGEEDR